MKLRTVLIVFFGVAIAYLLNATLRYAEVDVEGDDVVIRLGPLGNARIPRGLITEAKAIQWPWYFGYGIRFYGRQAVGFVGRPGGVVELTLSKPVRVQAAIPIDARRIAVAVQNPDDLIRLITQSA